MTPLQLKRAFVGLQILQNAYKKVEGILPTPSYTQKLTSSFYEDKIIIIFEIEHDLKSAIQYQWLSDIKIIWKRNIIIEFEYVNEFYINELTIQSGVKYSLTLRTKEPRLLNCSYENKLP